MFELLTALVSSVMSGGATGLLGILIQRWFDSKSKAQDIEVIKLNHENAVELRRIEIEQTAKEWEGRRDVAAEDRAAREAEAAAVERAAAYESDARMAVASIEHDRARYLSPAAQRRSKWAAFMMGAVDFTRGMVRPLLTAYLVIVVHLMFNWARTFAERNGQALSAADSKEILLKIIEVVLYLATVAVVWWFGTRPPKRSADR